MKRPQLRSPKTCLPTPVGRVSRFLWLVTRRGCTLRYMVSGDPT